MMTFLGQLFRIVETVLAAAMILCVQAYRLLLSPVLPPSCRFQPSCSAYAIGALRRHGPFRGGWLTLWRLLRCHPWGGMGWDPVPGPDCRNAESPSVDRVDHRLTRLHRN